MTRIRKQPLSKQHDRAGFDCGVAELNTFIQKTARRQDERHLVRTTVLVDIDQPEHILAYYSTAPCETDYPHPVPFLRMARLATHRSVQGQGFGELALLSAIDDAATISRTFTAIRACAAPEGLRRPCSHSCNVRGEIFKARANCAWESPVRRRAEATSWVLTSVVLAA